MGSKSGMMKGQKGKRDFHARLTQYAIEGGALARCPDHPGSVFRTEASSEGAHKVVEEAWRAGYIGVDAETAISQMDKIIARAPACCSQTSCWQKSDK